MIFFKFTNDNKKSVPSTDIQIFHFYKNLLTGFVNISAIFSSVNSLGSLYVKFILLSQGVYLGLLSFITNLSNNP